jgi:eukaryotic-like serine/threonine-protein kinase
MSEDKLGGSHRASAFQPAPDPDSAWDRFELAWTMGERPRIEDYLAGFSGAARRDLLAGLLAWEVEHRLGLGERPEPADYIGRFPDAVPVIEAAIEEATAAARNGDKLGTAPRAQWRPSAVGPVEAIMGNGQRLDANRMSAGSPAGPPPPPAIEPAVSPYRDLRFHARGGLGEVFRARDDVLGRDVALKTIQAVAAGSAEGRRRFEREATITGRLEHPGVAPVHASGHCADGRPYYVMRFIDGETLGEAIRRFHSGDGTGADLGARTMAYRGLLNRFVQVCQTIEYAHGRGILHRDIKPSNVMLGPHGETLVVDWGLAKVVDERGDEAGEPSGTSGLDLTAAGSVVGTPAFMAPEQFDGGAKEIGPASDLYSLGATLYCILTGRAPFDGDELANIRDQVRQGRFPRPRAVCVDVAPALEAVCLKAMALRPKGRHSSAASLADDVERWLADEPVTAYREPWSRRAVRWAQRHRTALASASAAAAAGLLLLTGIAWSRAEQRRRVNDSAQSMLGDAMSAATVARASGDLAHWEKAISQALLARERLDVGGSPDLLREVSALVRQFEGEHVDRRWAIAARERDRRMVATLDEAALQTANLFIHNGFLQMDDDPFLTAFRDYGIDVKNQPAPEAARLVRSSRVAADLVAALYDWMDSPDPKVPVPRLVEIAHLAETDPTMLAFRKAVANRDLAGLRRLCSADSARRISGPRLRARLAALQQLDRNATLPLVESLCRVHPADFWANEYLGLSYLIHGSRRESHDAVRYLSTAVAIRPDASAARQNLGLALMREGKLRDAVVELRESTRLLPNAPMPHYYLSEALRQEGDLEGAAAEFQEGQRPRLYRAGAGPRMVLPTPSLSSDPIPFGAPFLRHPLSDNWSALEIAHERFPGVLDGRATPRDAIDSLTLAHVAFQHRLYAASVRFVEAAFAEDSALAENLVKNYRSSGACIACVGGSEQGMDNPPPDEPARAALRAKARAWLRADLAARIRWIDAAEHSISSGAIRSTVESWKSDPNLAGIRDEPRLANWPASEQEACRALWPEVERFLAPTRR